MTLRAVLAAACLTAVSWGCAPGAASAPERVMVIVVDTTHAAHLGCYGGPDGVSPRIDALAAAGRRFAAARSNTTWTLPSSVSLLTGRLQESHGVVTNKHAVGDELTLLSERFRDAGYATAAFSEMIYASAVHGLDRGFDDALYYSMTAGAHPSTMGGDVLAWLDEHADQRWFVYVHMRRPHSPYEPNPLVQRRLAPDCALADGRLDETLAHADSRVQGPLPADQAAHVEHLYRANIANADLAVERLLTRLEGDDGALIVLTSDHGEALGQHGYWGHGYRLEAECVDVPLVFAGAGVTPGVDVDPACTVDVAPTLAELCRLEPLPSLDGRSLARRLEGEGGDPSRPLLLSSRYVPGRRPSYAVIADGFKLVLDPDDGITLYDLSADRGETVDVSSREPLRVERLAALARARRAAGDGLAERGAIELDVHEAELRALGYLR